VGAVLGEWVNRLSYQEIEEPEAPAFPFQLSDLTRDVNSDTRGSIVDSMDIDCQ